MYLTTAVLIFLKVDCLQIVANGFFVNQIQLFLQFNTDNNNFIVLIQGGYWTRKCSFVIFYITRYFFNEINLIAKQ